MILFKRFNFFCFMIIISSLVLITGCSKKTNSQSEIETESITISSTEPISEVTTESDIQPKVDVIRQRMHSFVVKDDIIFVNGNGLYKTSIDGSESVRILTDSVSDINIVGDWIYYINQSDQQKIYKVKNDGTKKIKISDIRANELIVSSNYIYAIDTEGNLARGKVNGKNIALWLLGDFDSLNFYDGYLYFVSGGIEYINTLNRIGQDADYADELFSFGDAFVYELILTEDYAFVRTDDGVYRMTHLGKDANLISGPTVEDIEVYNGHIYYVSDAGFSLTRTTYEWKDHLSILSNDSNNAIGKVYQLSALFDHLFVNDSLIAIEKIDKHNFSFNDISELYVSESDGGEEIQSVSQSGVLDKVVSTNSENDYWEGSYDIDGDGSSEAIALYPIDSYETWKCDVYSNTKNLSFELPEFKELYITDLNDDNAVEFVYVSEYGMFGAIHVYANVDGYFEKISEILDLLTSIENSEIRSGNNSFTFDGVTVKDQNGNIVP